jgi:septum formation protein
MDLILVSTSPYRRVLMERLGVAFRALAPALDEEEWKQRHAGATPRELAERLAEAKALSLIEAEPDATLVGGDQLVAFEGRILGKPGTPERAVEQLLGLSGRSHELITAIAVWSGGRIYRHTDVARLTMRSLDRAAVERYVGLDEPLDCAGSYKLESRGITLFERIECADHSAITGLPLMKLTQILSEIGYPIP